MFSSRRGGGGAVLFLPHLLVGIAIRVGMDFIPDLAVRTNRVVRTRFTAKANTTVRRVPVAYPLLLISTAPYCVKEDITTKHCAKAAASSPGRNPCSHCLRSRSSTVQSHLLCSSCQRKYAGSSHPAAGRNRPPPAFDTRNSRGEKQRPSEYRGPSTAEWPFGFARFFCLPYHSLCHCRVWFSGTGFKICM